MYEQYETPILQGVIPPEEKVFKQLDVLPQVDVGSCQLGQSARYIAKMRFCKCFETSGSSHPASSQIPSPSPGFGESPDQ